MNTSTYRVLGVLAAFFLATPSHLHAGPVLGDAAGQWSFDEDIGSAAVLDATDNANNGELVGPERFTPGVFAKGLRVETNEYVQIRDASSALKPPYEYAISAWVRSTGTGRQEVVSMGNSYALLLHNGEFATFYYIGGHQWPIVVSEDVGVNDGHWHHLVGQRIMGGGASWFELWFDGTLVKSIPASMHSIDYVIAPNEVSPHLVFGAWAGDEPFGTNFVGDIDEVWIFDRPLSPSEIYTLRVGNTIGPVYSCVGYSPPMDKGSVQVRKNRALPLKSELVDMDGMPVTDGDIVAPVVQVVYNPGIAAEPVDVTAETLAVGLGTEGNQFTFTDDGTWRINIKTTNYSARGTYTITMVPGDGYVVEPTCTTSFVIE